MKGWIFFILLFGCSENKSSWTYDSIDKNSSKIVYNSQTSFGGFDVEFLRFGDEIKAYLKVQSNKIHPLHLNQVLVSVQIEEKIIEEEATLLQGEQRVVLPKSLTNILISSLKEEKEIHIFMNGLENTLNPHPLFLKKLKNVLKNIPPV